jgi:glycosyltransferase involved in cell wall biosynthesis
MGFIDDKDKYSVFSDSKIFLIASEKEGWGISVLEANAAGLPAIGYDVEGLRDSIKDGYSGFIVKNSDISLFAAKIMQVLSDSALASKLSVQANAWAKGFSWDCMAENFYRIIRDKYGLLF